MWCSTCQQDVPGLGSASPEGDLRCGKCGGDFADSQPHVATSSESPISARRIRPTSLLEEDWALEADLRGVERMVKSLKSRSPLSDHGGGRDERRQSPTSRQPILTRAIPDADAADS